MGLSSVDAGVSILSIKEFHMRRLKVLMLGLLVALTLSACRVVTKVKVKMLSP